VPGHGGSRLDLGDGAEPDPDVVGHLLQPHPVRERRLHPGGLGVRAGRQPPIGSSMTAYGLAIV
jgi:hypothetical protein